jgi:DNA-binding winged helix-turn-helix (wHTH) protein
VPDRAVHIGGLTVAPGEAIKARELGRASSVDVGGLKQRALLAILLLHANQPVHRDVLIDQLWAEHPPAGAEHAVEVYIWRLRTALESAAGSQGVLTRPGAYLLQAEEEQVDVARFERLAEAGRRALAAEDPGRAAADLGEALALWRGDRWLGGCGCSAELTVGWPRCLFDAASTPVAGAGIVAVPQIEAHGARAVASTGLMEQARKLAASRRADRARGSRAGGWCSPAGADASLCTVM